jgi:hypothetical protein
MDAKIELVMLDVPSEVPALAIFADELPTRAKLLVRVDA